MKRRTWVALTALAVAVAVGVLAGMVVRLGGRVKDSATTRSEATFSATQTGFVVVDPSTTAPSATLMPAKGPNVAGGAVDRTDHLGTGTIHRVDAPVGDRLDAVNDADASVADVVADHDQCAGDHPDGPAVERDRRRPRFPRDPLPRTAPVPTSAPGPTRRAERRSTASTTSTTARYGGGPSWPAGRA